MYGEEYKIRERIISNYFVEDVALMNSNVIIYN